MIKHESFSGVAPRSGEIDKGMVCPELDDAIVFCDVLLGSAPWAGIPRNDFGLPRNDFDLPQLPVSVIE
jgi:hypothetical protein